MWIGFFCIVQSRGSRGVVCTLTVSYIIKVLIRCVCVCIRRYHYEIDVASVLCAWLKVKLRQRYLEVMT